MNRSPGIVAAVLLALGLLAELQVRHYYEPSRRVPYSVDVVLRTEKNEQSMVSE